MGRLGQLPAEYHLRMVRALLIAFPELCELRQTNEIRRVMKCDLELRIRKVRAGHRPILATLMLSGESAVKSKAVTEAEVAASRSARLFILNFEGVG